MNSVLAQYHRDFPDRRARGDRENGFGHHVLHEFVAQPAGDEVLFVAYGCEDLVRAAVVASEVVGDLFGTGSLDVRLAKDIRSGHDPDQLVTMDHGQAADSFPREDSFELSEAPTR